MRASALGRAVTALLDNAVRHASHAVSLTLIRQHERVLLDVTDDGPGVDPTLAPRLFDRFATARTDDTARPRRYGLGLALVAEIVAAHRGQVQLLNPGPETTPGKQGPTLRITLPPC